MPDHRLSTEKVDATAHNLQMETKQLHVNAEAKASPKEHQERAEQTIAPVNSMLYGKGRNEVSQELAG